jgi:hypothetical protein
MGIKALREYVRLHIISLEQDLDNEDGADSIVPYLEGAIEVSRHYLKVIDLMHGHLKVEMVDCEEMMKDNDDPFLQGYMEALTNLYCMTYNLSIERAHLENV